MKKSFTIVKNSLIVVILLMVSSAKAQDFLPFLNDNYSGVTSIYLQPASIANSRNKIDLTLFGFSTNLYNNYLRIDRKVFLDKNVSQAPNFRSTYMDERVNGNGKGGTMANQIQLFHLMYALNQNASVAFSARFRNILNIDNIPEDLARAIYNEWDYNPIKNNRLEFKNISYQQHAFVEYGFTYARTFFDTERKHFFKGGATVKMLQGLGAAYLFLNELTFELKNKDTAAYFKSDFEMGISESIKNKDLKFRFEANPSIAFDFGFVYEFRPNFADFKYDMDGERGLWRKDLNKYKVRVGFSLLDIGAVRYKKGYFAKMQGEVYQWDLHALQINQFTDLTDTLRQRFTETSAEPYFWMNLPTAISTQVDYLVVKSIYLNFTSFFSMRQGTSDPNKSHYLTSFSLTPRWETRRWGISMPFYINQYGNFGIGIGTRLGPVWIGTNDFAALVGIKQKISGADVGVLVKIPILYKEPKDRDHDQVSDRKDDCPDIAGLFTFNGCPDTDRDGIPDKDDRCPGEAGVKEFQGCPDTDGDGVMDKYDECPDKYGSKAYAGCPDSDEDGIIDKNDDCPGEKGLAIFKGCPDTDGDSIPDKDDDCPEVKGLLKFNGCPDTDNDGIPDSKDLCPSIAGLDSLQGCPYIDTDNDGIQDKYDACPTIPGPASNKGCPFVDTDGDGVLDIDDHCPLTPGSPSNHGCPVIEQAEMEILNTAFANLQFETGKSVIKSSSFSSLDELAALLLKKPKFKLLVEGHTDNVGRPESNMSLSQNRALAVKNYLVSKGVDESRITTRWFGDTKPIADNNTEEGRQKNRRVEMTVIFD